MRKPHIGIVIAAPSDEAANNDVIYSSATDADRACICDRIIAAFSILRKHIPRAFGKTPWTKNAWPSYCARTYIYYIYTGKLDNEKFTHHVRHELATLHWWDPSSSHWLDSRPGGTLICGMNRFLRDCHSNCVLIVSCMIVRETRWRKYNWIDCTYREWDTR